MRRSAFTDQITSVGEVTLNVAMVYPTEISGIAVYYDYPNFSKMFKKKRQMTMFQLAHHSGEKPVSMTKRYRL